MADLFDIAVARKLSGGGGGGGGSSDFSTAEVTFRTSLQGQHAVTYGELMDISIYNDYPTPLIAIYGSDADIIDNDKHTLILYQNKAYVCIYTSSSVTATGSAIIDEYDTETFLVTITGDCTITIS